MELGYVRASTTEQDLTRQLDALAERRIPSDRIWADKKTGAAERDGLAAILAHASTGDTIVVLNLDRLGITIRECLTVVHDLAGRGIGITTLADPLPFDSTDNSVLAQVSVGMLALLAQMERTFARERAAGARAALEARGGSPGRPQKLDADALQAAQAAVAAGMNVAEVAKLHGVSRATLYRHLPAAAENQTPPADRAVRSIRADVVRVTPATPEEAELSQRLQDQDRPVPPDDSPVGVPLGQISSYLDCATLVDLAAALVDTPDDYDLDELTDAVRGALNAGLAGTGISVTGDAVSSTDPGHEDSDDVDALISAAYAAADFGALISRYHRPDVAESLDTSVPNAPKARRKKRRALLDLDTVRQVRSTDESRPGWRVVAGTADDPVLIGWLEPTLTATGRRGSRWTARTAHHVSVSGGPWKTRNDALVHLVDVYQRAAVRT